MSTAILISGQLRTFARCWPTQRWHVLRHFADPHFFVTVQDTPDCQALDLLVADYGADRVHLDVRQDPDLTEHLTPELTAAYHLAPYANAAPAHQLLLQHWYQQEVWGHFLRCYGSPGMAKTHFDTVIRLRGDLWFHSFDDPFQRSFSRYYDKGTEMQVSGSVHVQSLCGANSCCTPWWGRFGGINDRFAIMGPEAARYYFTVFAHIPEALASGCPFHPESLVKANLERGNVDLHETLRTEFTTFRADGKHRPPEIAPWDLAHAALSRAA